MAKSLFPDARAEAETSSARAFPLYACVAVRTYELDSFGHVNNAVYLQYAEEARSEYLKQIGLSFHDFARFGIHLVIVEAQLRYLRPARYGDVVIIRGRFTDIRPASLTIEYIVENEADGTRIADIRTRGGCVDAATGKPTRTPAYFRDAFIRNAAAIGGTSVL